MKSGKIKVLKNLLKKQAFVRHAYVFGSVAEGRTGPLSDIDIAVAFRDGMAKRELAKKRLELMGKISKALKSDNFDLVVMNAARPSINRSIAMHGKVIKDGRDRVPMEAALMCEYLDMKYYDELYEAALLERISSRGLA